MAIFAPDQLAALSANTVRVAPLVQLDFRSETFRLWSGNTPLETGGHVYLPLKGHGSISGIPMQSGLSNDSVELTLSGLPDDETGFFAQALAETPEVQQQTAFIFLQFFDDGWQPIGGPVAMFFGFMQPPKITRSEMNGIAGGSQVISITLENALFNRSRPPAGRYTDRDQQFISPGDKIFQFVPSLMNKVFRYPDFDGD